MTNTDTRDVAATVAQILRLEEAGCELIRLAVPDAEAAAAFAEIKKKTHVPLIADIHFDYRLAIASMDAGADKIRINPGNIGEKDKIRAVVAHAKTVGIPIRIGVNSGSVEKDLLQKYGGPVPEALAESAERNIDQIRQMGFDDLIISIKSSNVTDNTKAFRILAEKTEIPFHIGITEAGVGNRALVKSAVGIGALLLDGLGDTIRVSLTADPVEEIAVAQDILASIDLLPNAINLISCPTCGRCRVNLPEIASRVNAALVDLEADRRKRGEGKKLTVAVMGCAVNGPGEASHADVGIACGRGNAVLFRNGQKVDSVSEEACVARLLDEIRLLL
jgi:(E)-4-hydroxy-3-methylbut-2-enyl-diphosphate synthase